jgi:hypothetical protein
MSMYTEFETDVNGHVVTTRPTAQQLANKAPALTPEVIAEIDRTRAAKREAKRLEIAGAIHAESEWARLNQVHDVDIPMRKELLATEHCTTAAPLQARLAELETAIITGIKERLPTDAALEAERTELLTKLQTMNADLKAAIAREDDLLNDVYKQRMKAGEKSNRCTLEQELVDLASPALQIALQVAGSSTRWAQARLTRAQEAKRTPVNLAELAFARAEVERTTQLEAAARQACLDE